MMLSKYDIQRSIGCVVGMLLLGLAVVAQAQTMRPFTTDGCSIFPDGMGEQKDLWLSCCVEHDRAYWLGGTYGERVAADEKLRQCVDAMGEPTVGKVMLTGVRVGGSPFWPTPYRWGYGWPYPRGYKELTAEEVVQAQRLLDAESSR